MSADFHERIDELFHGSLLRPPGARAAFLEKACGSDLALRYEVESLLAAHASVDGFLQEPLLGRKAAVCAAKAVETVVPDPPAAVGRSIGRYRIVEVVANGGMGIVYRALRADQSYDQQVAIKLIRRGMVTDAVRRRFQQERQTLAQLEHAYITRLIDGGTTEDGLPFLIMEYVDGKPIDRHCDTLRLDIAERIMLFRLVCEAVHFAHQNLVIHRDLKPSNVLITHGGVPKLLDFGIAKLLDIEGAGPADATITICRVLTPRYASPEQVRGEPVTTASDVYSLGVLLYELLTGHRPYDLKRTSSYENERIICEEEPATPSLVVGRADNILSPGDTTESATPETVCGLRRERPVQLRRRLRGDLDNIVLMAMQKDPRRRYASVQEFSEDLRRYLEGLPVAARKDTLSYRTTKLVKRNKGIVIVSSALAVALLIGMLGTTIGLVRTQEAERLAHDERIAATTAQRAAQSVAAFLQELLAAANPYRTGRDVSVILELLDDASKRVSEEYAGRPATEAAVRYAIANTYAGLWHWRDAEPHLRRALSLNRKLHGDLHPSVADCLILLGRALTFGQNEEAIPVQREALAIRRHQFAEDSAEVAWAKTCLAFALWHSTCSPQMEEAERLAYEALAVQRPLIDDHPVELALSLHTVAAMLTRKGAYEDSARVFQEAVDVYRSLPDQEDRYLAEAIRGYANALEHLHTDREKQERLLREYIDRTPVGFFTEGTARNAMWRVGELVRSKARSAGKAEAAAFLSEAESWFRKALSAECAARLDTCPGIRRTLEEIQSASASDRDPAQVAEATTRLLEVLSEEASITQPFIERSASPVKLLVNLDRYDTAASLFARRLAVLQKGCSERVPIHIAQARLGFCKRELGEFDDAERLLLESYHGLLVERGQSHAITVAAARRLAGLYEAWGHPESAAPYQAMADAATGH